MFDYDVNIRKIHEICNVNLYTSEQLKVLQVRPGITDPASIRYRNENELLAQVPDPEKYYREVIMPDKLKINLKYIANK